MFAMRPGFFIARIFALVLLPVSLVAQTPKEVQNAFAALRSDDVPGNAVEAQRYLFEHYDRVREQLPTELYKTDRQGRDGILLILFSTKSYVPDEHFARFVLARMAEHDKYVSGSDLAYPEDYASHEEYASRDPGEKGGSSAHILAWKFIDRHFAFFMPFLTEQVGRTRDIRSLWSIAWLLERHGLLPKFLKLFKPEVLAWAADNLRDDRVEFNASQAARLFLILGKKGIPTLNDAAARSKDAQQKAVARALIKAITKGDDSAFLRLGDLVGMIDLGSNRWGGGLKPWGARP